ncbi:unnamed protein product [Amoebophrya sp. A120]|nr:unnamed protein product [Amoebophrya sp. A120]|eukprot:GSA120T00009322001.1
MVTKVRYRAFTMCDKPSFIYVMKSVRVRCQLHFFTLLSGFISSPPCGYPKKTADRIRDSPAVFLLPVPNRRKKDL